MNSILSLSHWILFGDFGLLTLTPRYLFGVLFPVMVFLGFLSSILARIPFMQQNHPLVNQLFYALAGLGCTTAALAACQSIQNKKMHRRVVWLLILIIPCSSQIAIIAAFASMVTFRVFFTYLLFTGILSAGLYFLLAKVYPLTQDLIPLTTESTQFRPIIIVKEAFLSVTSTIPSFCVGSIVISILMYCGIMDSISRIFAPWLQAFLHLPEEAASLFILNLFKRDFGSASLLNFAETGAFDAVQMVVILIMLTFCVPCFNSTILLYKQEKLPGATLIWMGSLFICILFGRIVSTILFVSFV